MRSSHLLVIVDPSHATASTASPMEKAAGQRRRLVFAHHRGSQRPYPRPLRFGQSLRPEQHATSWRRSCRDSKVSRHESRTVDSILIGACCQAGRARRGWEVLIADDRPDVGLCNARRVVNRRAGRVIAGRLQTISLTVYPGGCGICKKAQKSEKAGRDRLLRHEYAAVRSLPAGRSSTVTFSPRRTPAGRQPGLNAYGDHVPLHLMKLVRRRIITNIYCRLPRKKNLFDLMFRRLVATMEKHDEMIASSRPQMKNTSSLNV